MLFGNYPLPKKMTPVPQKPFDISEPVVKWGRCPICKGEQNVLLGRPNRVLASQQFCPDCGQALDWRETDELEK